ncbi:MAG TPA: glutathione S-transferase family protein, partial [Polyangiaceae bacterium]|nr:glutathione S-transferase family protein [Polyangiaceae bacterium]
MGRMVDGKWTTEWYSPDQEGRFVRNETHFRARIGSEPDATHPVASGRYHLYVAHACPWAHRTLMGRALYGLDAAISVSVVHPDMGDDGWTFIKGDGGTGDTQFSLSFLREIYLRAKPDYTGRVTVPVLWDKPAGTIVNNESREILRMMSRELRGLGSGSLQLCPAGMETEVDAVIDDLYNPINNGVYRAGFATTQHAYAEAVTELFDALARYEQVLGKQRYLCGANLTEADLCLFSTLLRFDPVYHYHFKCNLKRLRDFPNLWGFTLELAQIPQIQQTIFLPAIKQHYLRSHPTVNPTRVVPLGPEIDWEAAHGRDAMP